MGELLPLFPLGTVLLPGAPLPLRIFEPRYRTLLADITAPGAARRFGVVTLTAGIEVDTELVESRPEFADVGTVAEILEVVPADDGSATLLAVGSRRFRIEASVPGMPYHQAEVEFLDERVGELPDTLPHAARALATEYQRLLALAAGTELEQRGYPRDPVALSYRVAVEAPLALSDQQSLLVEDTATARLQQLVRLLRREVALLRYTRSVPLPPGLIGAALRPN